METYKIQRRLSTKTNPFLLLLLFVSLFVFALFCFYFVFLVGWEGGCCARTCRPMCVSLHASVCACMQVKTHCTLSLQQKLYDNSVFVKTIMESLHKENN